MVDNELELTFDDLLAREQIERTSRCRACRTPWRAVRRQRAVAGRSLADLLAEAGVDPGATQLLSTSVDGWTCGTPVSSLNDGRDAMLAIAMNGEPLPAEHGYPVRMVVPGVYGYVSATKWVTEIELTTWEDVDAYWVPRGWSKQAPVKTMTRIETPRTTRPSTPAPWPSPARLGGAPRRLGGGGAHRRRRMGARPSWAACPRTTRGASGSSSSTWNPASTRSRLARRTATGAVETEEVAGVAPDGAQGYDMMTLEGRVRAQSCLPGAASRSERPVWPPSSTVTTRRGARRLLASEGVDQLVEALLEAGDALALELRPRRRPCRRRRRRGRPHRFGLLDVGVDRARRACRGRRTPRSSRRAAC